MMQTIVSHIGIAMLVAVPAAYFYGHSIELQVEARVDAAHRALADQRQELAKCRSDVEDLIVDPTPSTDTKGTGIYVIPLHYKQLMDAIGDGLKHSEKLAMAEQIDGVLKGRSNEIETMLRRRILNERGGVADPMTVCLMIVKRAIRLNGKDGARRAMIASFGAEAGSALMKLAEVIG